jgi:hypothetical protein
LLRRLDAVEVVDGDVAALFGEGGGEEGAETAVGFWLDRIEGYVVK